MIDYALVRGELVRSTPELRAAALSHLTFGTSISYGVGRRDGMDFNRQFALAAPLMGTCCYCGGPRGGLRSCDGCGAP